MLSYSTVHLMVRTGTVPWFITMTGWPTTKPVERLSLTDTTEHINSDAGSSGPTYPTQGVGGANIHHNNGLLDI